MKKLSLLFFILFIFSLTFCTTTNETGVPQNKLTVKLNSLQVPLGEIETQIEYSFPKSGLGKRTIKVIYFPDEDAVCLNYRTGEYIYYFFFDYEAREQYLSALNKYMEEYEARVSIIDNEKKTKAIYGKAGSFIIWQRFSFARQLQMNTEINYGYVFKTTEETGADNIKRKSRAPYFAVTQKNVDYVAPDKNTREEIRSGENVLLFVRAQAQELADLFDEDLLRQHLLPKGATTPSAEAW